MRQISRDARTEFIYTSRKAGRIAVNTALSAKNAEGVQERQFYRIRRSFHGKGIQENLKRAGPERDLLVEKRETCTGLRGEGSLPSKGGNSVEKERSVSKGVKLSEQLATHIMKVARRINEKNREDGGSKSWLHLCNEEKSGGNGQRGGKSFRKTVSFLGEVKRCKRQEGEPEIFRCFCVKEGGAEGQKRSAKKGPRITYHKGMARQIRSKEAKQFQLIDSSGS